ncbi:MAG: hypothetical protein RIK87_09830 [Fuerstiella sp.]
MNDFDCLGNFLYNRTEDILLTGGLFHVRAFARQMLQFDRELRRRAGGDEWADVDLTRTRASLELLANLVILPPEASRRTRRRPVPRRRSMPRFGSGPGPGPAPQPDAVDPEDVFEEPLHPVGVPRSPSDTPRHGGPLSWILGESTSEVNVAPGINATPDGATMIGGVRIGRIGQAGNLARMQRQWMQEGAEDADTDAASSDAARAHRQRIGTGRYRGNQDYRIGYDRRWQVLERRVHH